MKNVLSFADIRKNTRKLLAYLVTRQRTKWLTVKRHPTVFKSIGAEARIPGFKSQFYHLLTPSLRDKDIIVLTLQGSKHQFCT